MTDTRMLAVLTDLAQEGDWLDTLVASLDEPGWRTPTPAEGWDIATTVAHLAWTDEAAVIAATDTEAWDRLVREAVADPEGFVDAQAVAGAQADGADLLARWRTARQRLARTLTELPAGTKLPWFGPSMSPTSMATARYMEIWAHGLDVADALGVQVEPHDRVRHVVHLGVRTRAFSFANAGLPVPESEVRLELVAPSGEHWSYGPEHAAQRVTGSAWDFALLVTQRRHLADLDVHATGTDAAGWLEIAQAFAGPSGNGRAPAHAEPR